jgi:hypothetical protein
MLEGPQTAGPSAWKLGAIGRYSMMFANPWIFTMLRPANET